MRPLDRLSSIKTKLGAVIVAAVGVTIAVVALGVRAGIPLLLLGFVAGILALSMVQFLARGMTSPLRDMAAATHAMAAGDYSRRVPQSSRDEVGELARAFNRMARDLEEVDRMRRDLVANVSHELRTPITALQAVLENLVDHVALPDDDTLRTMLGQVERLGRLVAQLLDLSRLESGASPLQRRDFMIQPVLEQSVREAALHDPAVELRVEVEPEHLSMNGDPERIHQVVANLIDNAVRHSPPAGKVTVAARSNDDIKIEISDEGPGIPAAEHDRIFERFYRSDEARSSDGGSGLGLAIVRWIVDLHEGSIAIEDAEPSGCLVAVTLPKRALLP